MSEEPTRCADIPAGDARAVGGLFVVPAPFGCGVTAAFPWRGADVGALQQVRRFDEARASWEHAVNAFAETGDVDTGSLVRGWMDGLPCPRKRR